MSANWSPSWPSVNYTGTTSMEIGIKVMAENIRTQDARHANSCFFTMVAVDDERKPVAVPPLQPAPGDEARRFQEAVLRSSCARNWHSASGRSAARQQQLPGLQP